MWGAGEDRRATSPIKPEEGLSACHRASQALAAAARALTLQWQEHFGYVVQVAESFTVSEQFAGTCYKAAGWESVGFSEGNTRHRADFYVPNERPKRLWLKELVAAGRKTLCALNFRIGGVLTLTAMAIFCGACGISQIARFATRLCPKQRARLGIPRKTGKQAFYRVPSYSVINQVLKRMDAEEFARRLCPWLQAAAGTLPGALALDGKTITADALHCQKETARLIVEKGGDFPLQIKANFLAISLASLAR